MKTTQVETFSFSHGKYRSRNQRIFELQKCFLYHMKGFELFLSTMLFSKILTETLSLKKPKNPETLPSNTVCQ